MGSKRILDQKNEFCTKNTAIENIFRDLTIKIDIFLIMANCQSLALSLALMGILEIVSHWKI